MIILHTSHGDITLELDAENAPATVANFLQYVRDGHYDNTIFHRVVTGFVVQGGIGGRRLQAFGVFVAQRHQPHRSALQRHRFDRSHQRL